MGSGERTIDSLMKKIISPSLPHCYVPPPPPTHLLHTYVLTCIYVRVGTFICERKGDGSTLQNEAPGRPNAMVSRVVRG